MLDFQRHKYTITSTYIDLLNAKGKSILNGHNITQVYLLYLLNIAIFVVKYNYENTTHDFNNILIGEKQRYS